jgi:glycogen debranching enzyme
MVQFSPAIAHDTIHRAYRIAVRDLRACYNPDGIVAGRLHFNAYWARDGFFASFGALALGDVEQVRAQLGTFIQFQTASGELPVRIEFLGHTLGTYHTRLLHPKALFRAGSIFADPLDPSALFIIAAREYFSRTNDMAFCARFEPAMDRAMQWLMSQDRDGDGLLENRYLAGWMDSILKKDKVFYLNLIYYEGLRACRTIKEWLGHMDDARRFDDAARKTHDALQRVFWNGTYFTDWTRGGRHGGFCSDGNVLAILFGIATADQAQSILRFIDARGLDRDTPLRTCDPVYPFWQVFPFYFLAGIPDYHRALIWPCLGTLHAVNKFRLGRQDDAVADLARIGAWYASRNAVAEVYESDGMMLNRRFYQAEVPFAWNAGLYVYAVHALNLLEASTAGP